MRPAPQLGSMPVLRRGLRVRGIVQGVGFRPAVHRLASSLALSGLVRNDTQGVWVEVEGPADRVAQFERDLSGALPPLARVDAVEAGDLPPLGGAGFHIEPSASHAECAALVPVDVAPCANCLRELWDPADRRHRYPFLNCTACGPRYTIVEQLPYDRANTTMAAFTMCAACRAEYEDPSHRRFHAEPTACPECGPRLAWVGPPALSGEAALGAAVQLIAGGGIVAIKGAGGFLLAADATREAAVAELRERKRRPHKPFAVMARDLATAARLVELSGAARAALVAPSRPIVLAPLRDRAAIAPSVAPGLRDLGIQLPSTPLHELLLHDGPPLVVMTSGNRADEPIAMDNDDARARLRDIADGFLVHGRPIFARADDSVVRIVRGEPQPVRRARGFVPDPIELPFAAPPILAVGGELKNTICITRGAEAHLSPHLGDLSCAETHAFFVETIDKLAKLLGVRPQAVAHDLHPDYASTRWAQRSRLPCVPVQHHHAHIASCLAEHGRTGPTIGVAFDGTGCGPDGTLWGGELLLADLAGFRRLGHLCPLALPGGQAAIRQPWRIALAALLDAGEAPAALGHITAPRKDRVRRLIESGVACPKATGAGRWFDAVAALCALRDDTSYEGQAAVELEAIAAPGEHAPYPFELAGGVVDLRPMVREIVRAREPAPIVAARFHETLARAIVAGCRAAREAVQVPTVALSGGCFQNVRLSERASLLLEQAGFEVLLHRRVPPNDGGLALGQAAIAGFCAQKGSHVSGHSR